MSYTYEEESRGVGAIAASDLGASAFVNPRELARRSRKPRSTTPRRRDRRKKLTRQEQAAWEARRKRALARRAASKARTTPVLARPAATRVQPAKTVIGAQGAPLAPKSTTQTTAVNVPASQPPSVPVAPPSESATQAVTISSTPVGLPSAGLMPSPGLTDAVSELHSAIDARAEDDMTVATVEADAATSSGIPKPLLIGGIIGGAALLYLLLKK